MGAHLSSFTKGLSLEDDQDDMNGEYYPTEKDVHAAQDLLLNFFPLELANIILEEAKYWPVASIERDDHINVPASLNAVMDTSLCYLFTPPILQDITDAPEGNRKVKKVMFEVTSHDQGWGGDPGLKGVYDGSWTWFETAIYRPSGDPEAEESPDPINIPEPASDDLQDTRFGQLKDEIQLHDTHQRFKQVQNTSDKSNIWRLQANARASSASLTHHIVWTEDETLDEKQATQLGCGRGIGFVNSLSPGDRIAIIARAQFPGWSNFVEKVRISIFYSIT